MVVCDFACASGHKQSIVFQKGSPRTIPIRNVHKNIHLCLPCLIYYQKEKRHPRPDQSHAPPKRLFLTTGATEGLTGVCLYFLRMTNDKAVSIPNIWSEVHFGMMDCNNGKLLEEFQNTFAKVMMPALKSQEVTNKTFIYLLLVSRVRVAACSYMYI